jgi:hypothetical protein
MGFQFNFTTNDSCSSSSILPPCSSSSILPSASPLNSSCSEAPSNNDHENTNTNTTTTQKQFDNSNTMTFFKSKRIFPSSSSGQVSAQELQNESNDEACLDLIGESVVIHPFNSDLNSISDSDSVKNRSAHSKTHFNTSPQTLYKRHISDVKLSIAQTQDSDMDMDTPPPPPPPDQNTTNHDKDGVSWIDSVFLHQTDLIAGVYEGGFKTWECALDLVQYLMLVSDQVLRRPVGDQRLRVMEVIMIMIIIFFFSFSRTQHNVLSLYSLAFTRFLFVFNCIYSIILCIHLYLLYSFLCIHLYLLDSFLCIHLYLLDSSSLPRESNTILFLCIHLYLLDNSRSWDAAQVYQEYTVYYKTAT